MAGARFPARATHILFRRYLAVSPGVNRLGREADRSLPSSVEFKTDHTPSYRGIQLIKHRDNLRFNNINKNNNMAKHLELLFLEHIQCCLEWDSKPRRHSVP